MQNFIANIPRTARMAIGIILVVLMGIIDYVTGREFSFSIFYLIPIFIVVWYSGRWDGIIIALLGSIVWLVVDKMGSKGSITDAIVLWNALVRFGFFIIIVNLVSLLRKFNIELEEKVIARTADLTAEIHEREKAEKELKNITEKLRELTERIHTIREEESKIIAREIHDELGQALTAIKIDAAWISKRYSND
jgi:glucose-6-phosphate-specific signal transduction histidine kinase